MLAGIIRSTCYAVKYTHEVDPKRRRVVFLIYSPCLLSRDSYYTSRNAFQAFKRPFVPRPYRRRLWCSCISYRWIDNMFYNVIVYVRVHIIYDLTSLPFCSVGTWAACKTDTDTQQTHTWSCAARVWIAHCYSRPVVCPPPPLCGFGNDVAR